MSFSRPEEFEVAEIIWENGQLAMLGHGHGRANETLESIVHQATTCHNQSQNLFVEPQQDLPRSSNIDLSSEKLSNSVSPSWLKKRPFSTGFGRDQCGRNLCATTLNEDATSIDVITSSEDQDTKMMTWHPLDSSTPSLKRKDMDGSHACRIELENQEECKIEGEPVRSHSTQRSRATDTHNQTERRRREKINQKIKTLQNLVPNANKTDKASMLDEVIEYLKKLQAQVKLMKNLPMPPQMMIPSPLQQHQLHMSMLAQMGIGFGLQMGMPGVLPPPPQHPFLLPQMMTHPAHVGATSQARHTSPATNAMYTTFLPQSMSMDLYNNMTPFYGQQAVTSRASPSQPNHVRGE